MGLKPHLAGGVTAAASGAPVSVLVVEDEDLTASALRECLQQEGFSVLMARDGLEALEQAKQRWFDVLLTDLRMPNLDGAELIRRLRRDRPALPVVVMTGHVPTTWMQDLHKDGEGPIRLLHKPASLRVVVKTLHDVLERNA